MTADHAPGSFVGDVPTAVVACDVPAALRLQFGRDPDSVQYLLCDVADGQLSVIVSRDGGLWHLSVAVAGPSRRLPTWDELKWIKYRVVPEDVPMVLLFPRAIDAYLNTHEKCLHLWEMRE